MKTDRVLVPTDGSAMSLSVLKTADELVASSGGELTVMYVHAPVMQLMDDDFPEPEQAVQSLLDRAEHQLSTWMSELATPEGRRHVIINTGSPVAEIIERSGDFDLVVMATHGHTGLDHFRLGSVTERVVRGAQCSVLVVKNRDD